MKGKKVIKIIAISLACVIGAAALLIGGYVAYVALQYYRIDDGVTIEVQNGSQVKVKTGEEYSVMTYNVGFAAYSPEYSFFMDEGIMKDGTKTVGKYAKALNKADVEKNVAGQIATANAANADFYFFQEVDKKAHRSYKTDMVSAFSSAFGAYAYTFTENFHTAYLLYPFNDPIGQTVGGLMTLSKYNIESGVRRSFPLTNNFIDKLFDLDRCFAVHYLPVEGTDRQLALINLHMSAYDESGAVRKKQLEMLNAVLTEEYAKGNFVIAGGDFNHCLITDEFESGEAALGYFESDQLPPEWIKYSVLSGSEIAEGFTIRAALNAPTCRGADIPYEKGKTFTTVIDGFIVSDNVEFISVKNDDAQFAYSDHNPAVMKFRLK